VRPESSPATVLVVEDDSDTAELLRDALRKQGYRATAVSSARAALEALTTTAIDVVVTDVLMDGMSGIDLCAEIHERYPDTMTLILTGAGSLDVAVGAIRAGAYDFVSKPIKLDVLLVAIERALEHGRLQDEVRRLRSRVDRAAPIAGIVGESPAVRAATALIHRVADSDATVLITGESGTGKELVARSLHDLSGRREAPFVAINCAAMPAPLLESELFGHVKGAFTDARRTRPGLFVQAAGGTLFLDEIGDMPLEMQVKLLRALQERKVRPVGSDEEIAFDARVVCATNRDLDLEVAEKRFREDLYYRINVVAIEVPPLRARGGDVIVLANHFLRRIAERTGKKVATISPDAAHKLSAYDWPGNIRELENCMERSMALCQGAQIEVVDLPAKIKEHQSTRLVIATDAPDELITLDEMAHRYVRQVLSAVGGNKTHAARVLGIDRRSLYRRLDTRNQTTGSTPTAARADSTRSPYAHP
jgi:DNA-binding NtrC family response regulator